MELSDYIDEAAKTAGSLTALGKMLGQESTTMSSYKAYRRHLPTELCIRIADYIGADRIAVIAAAELATEKKEDKRAFWRPFVEHAKAASIVLGISLVTNFVTPTDAQAAPRLEVADHQMWIISTRQYQRHLKQWQLTRAIGRLLHRLQEALVAMFPGRITQEQPI